jgi:serine/threonine protein kinase/Tol biopolymer transport system component
MDALGQLQLSLAGCYAIERELARGGMATVFLARDVKHNRHVALKVLNPELGAVLGVERFLSEIQVTAHLQHPNLLPLFDSGDADGLLYYVMPYVAGESLRTKLSREKQLPVDEALHIATAVASALDYAHRHGVIHRDLKPENVLLHEGEPLVADFGIALAVSAAGGDRITQSGLSLGTPQYMSPEQATGDRAIDARTDVYSLGAVLYEMLTGEPPHIGNTSQAIIARVINEQPRRIRATRATVPDQIDRAVLRALEKLPADRWHTAHEFADALAGRGAPVASPSDVRTPGALPPRLTGVQRFFDRRALTIGGVLVVAVMLAALVASRVVAPSAAPSVSFVIDPPVENGVSPSISDWAISTDGQSVALVAETGFGRRAYLRRLSGPNVSPIPDTRDAVYVALSPDGKWLGVITRPGKLLKVRVDGTAPVMTLADGIEVNGLTWADNETLVLGSDRPRRPGLWTITATGGGTRALMTAPKTMQHGLPYVAPDRKTVFFSNWGPGFQEDDYLAIGSLETGAFKSSSLLVSRAVGVVDGRVLYTTGTSLMAVPFDAQRLSVSGDPVRVLENITIGQGGAALSPNGTLVYSRGQATSRLVMLDRDGGVQALSSDEHAFWNYDTGGPRYSPDGQRIAVAVWAPSGDTTVADVFLFDVKSRAFTRVTSQGDIAGAVWTPDGKRLVFVSWFLRNPTLWMQVADGSGRPERLYQATSGVRLFRPTVTPDGRGVLFCQQTRVVSGISETVLYYMPLSGERKPEPVVDEPMDDWCMGTVSPDGKWLAYVVTEGSTNVYVRRFRAPGGPIRISERAGYQPIWSRDGRRVFYATKEDNERNWVKSATVTSSGNSLDVVAHERILALPETGLFDVSPDGNRILGVQQSDSRVQLIVTTNWLPQLRARLAGRQ